MIARIWRGRVLAKDGDDYVAYVEATGMRDYATVPGNRGAHLLRRDRDDHAEIVTLTFWDSWEAIRAFAGDDPSVAKYYLEDDRYLLERMEHVEHYEVPFTSLEPA